MRTSDSANVSDTKVASAPPLPATPARLLSPQIRIFGEIRDETLSSFLDQIDRVQEDHVTVEVCTPGGDADVGRRIKEEIRILRGYCGKTLWFSGRTIVYSAGATIMSAFPTSHRFLSRDCIILVHERKLDKDLRFSSALSASEQDVDQLKSEIAIGKAIEQRGFRDLIEGSDVSFEQICDRARRNWYLTADEALRLKMIAGVY